MGTQVLLRPWANLLMGYEVHVGAAVLGRANNCLPLTSFLHAPAPHPVLEILSIFTWGGCLEPVTSLAFSLPERATSVRLREALHWAEKRKFLDFLCCCLPLPQVALQPR